jgi:dTDP-4-amino-4,6-dideoxygalactose transaminase
MDERILGVSRNEFAEALRAEGIRADVGYIAACVYEYPFFRTLNAYEGTNCPWNCPLYSRGNYRYEKGLCPTAEEVLATCIKMPVNEFFTQRDCEETIAAIRKVASWYAAGSK